MSRGAVATVAGIGLPGAGFDARMGYQFQAAT